MLDSIAAYGYERVQTPLAEFETSLTEALGKLFQATHSNTPSRRGELAQRLLACIHLQSAVVEEGSVPHRIVLPSVWLSTSRSANDLVCTGLSSVVPNGCDCLGSTHFAHRLKLGSDRTVMQAALEFDTQTFFRSRSKGKR